MNVYMVVDIGGSKYISGFVSDDGQILYQERKEWTKTSVEAIVEQLIASLRGVCATRPELAEQAKAGGVTIPGIADPATGVWVESDFLLVKNLPICERLSMEFKIPFFADNDGNACALAEKYFGSAKEDRDFLYMTVSTGIGGALILDDELYYGEYGHAGEIGMLVVEEQGRFSDTGSVQGNVEMYASGRGLRDNYVAASGIDKISNQPVDGKVISELAAKGDLVALEALALEGDYLGRILANAYSFAKVEKIIIGGGVALMFERFKPNLLKEFFRIHPEAQVIIEVTSLGYSGAFLGAAAVARRGCEAVELKSMGRQGQTVLRFSIGDEVGTALEVDDKVLASTHCENNNFLIARALSDSGATLRQMLKEEERQKDLREFGKGIGKAVACGCVLFDPGKVIIEGEGTSDESFRSSLEAAVIEETYYRGKLPFAIEYRGC
ncbi:ROK family protein [Ohessyouella blattaphilus]|uniref:ROK family protein n=1 Tax=Ohessyouella blattaphilus TaxID=2949333 RepID=A0ABT1EM94_9FIRM|nr:ROK family protein [Ohessyouella blattaphilus]MCP1110402.1 ROK family protein [Ohessyouella blattaphilus]MCR8563796.1 ROK family protein [Ohessyouella blattaphilus]